MTKTLTARRLRVLAAPALLVLSLSACGGGGGAPEDASQEDFCQVYTDEPDLDESLSDASPEEQAKAIKDAADDLADSFEETGTPEDIPDDAREGFEISLDNVKALDEDEIKKAIEDEDADFFDSDVSDGDKKKVEAFEKWASEYCA